jgi:hypothetical protein
MDTWRRLLHLLLHAAWLLPVYVITLSVSNIWYQQMAVAAVEVMRRRQQQQQLEGGGGGSAAASSQMPQPPRDAPANGPGLTPPSTRRRTTDGGAASINSSSSTLGTGRGDPPTPGGGGSSGGGGGPAAQALEGVAQELYRVLLFMVFSTEVLALSCVPYLGEWLGRGLSRGAGEWSLLGGESTGGACSIPSQPIPTQPTHPPSHPPTQTNQPGLAVNLVFLSWLYAFYCFDYGWSLQGVPLAERIAFFERRWAFFAGALGRGCACMRVGVMRVTRAVCFATDPPPPRFPHDRRVRPPLHPPDAAAALPHCVGRPQPAVPRFRPGCVRLRPGRQARYEGCWPTAAAVLSHARLRLLGVSHLHALITCSFAVLHSEPCSCNLAIPSPTSCSPPRLEQRVEPAADFRYGAAPHRRHHRRGHGAAGGARVARPRGIDLVSGQLPVYIMYTKSVLTGLWRGIRSGLQSVCDRSGGSAEALAAVVSKHCTLLVHCSSWRINQATEGQRTMQGGKQGNRGSTQSSSCAKHGRSSSFRSPSRFWHVQGFHKALIIQRDRG